VNRLRDKVALITGGATGIPEYLADGGMLAGHPGI
jgi:NAD(P)-dependent dehydrogenase (short-subunit alcohol dehydrogenase family)